MGDTVGWHERGGTGGQDTVPWERRALFGVLHCEAGSIADLVSFFFFILISFIILC